MVQFLTGVLAGCVVVAAILLMGPRDSQRHTDWGRG